MVHVVLFAGWALPPPWLPCASTLTFVSKTAMQQETSNGQLRNGSKEGHLLAARSTKHWMCAKPCLSIPTGLLHPFCKNATRKRTNKQPNRSTERQKKQIDRHPPTHTHNTRTPRTHAHTHTNTDTQTHRHTDAQTHRHTQTHAATHTWTFHCYIHLCHERKVLGHLFSPHDPNSARSPKSARFMNKCYMFWMFCGYLRSFCGYLRPFCMFHMFPRNRLYEMREAAAAVKHARIQKCARFSEKRPTSNFLLRNTQGTQIYVTNKGPGMQTHTHTNTHAAQTQTQTETGI